MDTNNFSWGEESAALISLEQLRESTSLQDWSGKMSKKAPFKHTEIIDTILEFIGSTAIIDQIYVAKNRSRFIKILDPNDEGLLKARVFESLIAKIKVQSLSNDEMSMMYAIQYSPKGITIAQGTNIEICSNMTILNSNDMVSTSGLKGLPYEKMMDLFKLWNIEKAANFNRFQEAIEVMKNTLLTSDNQIQEMIGDMQLLAVKQAYFSEYGAPLTLNELSKVSQALVSNDSFKNNKPITLWEIYNIFTNTITHSKTNLDTKILDTTRVSEYILNKYVPNTIKVLKK